MTRRDAEKIEVSVTFKHITDRAVLVNDGDKDIWLPLSMVDGGDIMAMEPGDVVELLLPEWLAKEKGLI
jgi:hypothetical protein